MDCSPLISVIVPIYKVEPYLPKCIESLLAQTYRALEIILVDDGSPDGCGAIADTYAKKDGRIKVLHQENKGLSAARNTGIRYASGEYIGFVDSDDWVTNDMYRLLVEAAESYGAEISVCHFCYVYPNGREEIRRSDSFRVTAEEAIELLVAGEILQDYVCNKLFKRKLFDTIRFPEGKHFEDISTTYQIVQMASHIICIPQACYYYLQRDTGIVRSNTLRNELDCFYAKLERYYALEHKFPHCIPKMMAGLGHSAVKVWATVKCATKEEQQKYADQIGAISAFVNQHYSQIKSSAVLGITGRCTLALVRVNSTASHWVSKMLWDIYKLKHHVDR